MEILIILITLILLMTILTIGIKELINNNNPLIELILFMLIFSIILVFITLIVTFLKEEPKAIDVYRGATTLEITYKDGIPIDSTVVWKEGYK